jgi:hypothetical protein
MIPIPGISSTSLVKRSNSSAGNRALTFSWVNLPVRCRYPMHTESKTAKCNPWPARSRRILSNAEKAPWWKSRQQKEFRTCCSDIQRQEGRPTCWKPGSKSLLRLGRPSLICRRGASHLTGRGASEPGSPEIRAPRETDCGRVGSAELFRPRRRPSRHRRPEP